ncbi:hypothetical protein [Phreatobacter sp.]|uniref:hypothetical protein n=1 Tax=Phreatobacter sp. TaxID=1966341 RepID=UPI003F703A47
MTHAAPLIPVSEALAALLAGLTPPAPRTVAVRGAVGLVAAEAVASPGPVPALWIARRAGIAVASSDLVGASAYAPALLSVAPAHVAAAGPLPPGTDAVLPADALQGAGGLFEIGQSAHPGENAVPAGSDLVAGASLLDTGVQITPEHRLALEAAGLAEVKVCVPRYALEAAPDCAGLRWLAARLEALGCRRAARCDADLVLLAETAGADARGIALRPGHAHLAARDGRTLLALPPRFDGVVAAFVALILPLLARLTGRRMAHVTRPLTRKVASMVGATDLVLLRESSGGWEPLAVGEAPLSGLLAAGALGIVPPESEGAAAGTPFDAILINSPLAPEAA